MRRYFFMHSIILFTLFSFLCLPMHSEPRHQQKLYSSFNMNTQWNEIFEFSLIECKANYTF